MDSRVAAKALSTPQMPMPHLGQGYTGKKAGDNQHAPRELSIPHADVSAQSGGQTFFSCHDFLSTDVTLSFSRRVIVVKKFSKDRNGYAWVINTAEHVLINISPPPNPPHSLLSFSPLEFDISAYEINCV